METVGKLGQPGLDILKGGVNVIVVGIESQIFGRLDFLKKIAKPDDNGLMY